MKNFFTTIQKLCLALLVVACTEAVEEPTSNQLMEFWQRKIELSPAEQEKQALENIAHSNDDYLKAISHFIVGYYERAKANYAAELEHYEKAQFFLTESGLVDDKLLGHIYRNNGLIAHKFSEYDQAISYYDSALVHYNHYPSNFTNERMTTLYFKGISLKLLHEFQDSQEVFNKLIGHARVVNNTQCEIKAMRQLGEVNIKMSNYAKAETYLKQSIKLLQESGVANALLELQLYQSLSKNYYYYEDFEQQEIYLRRALDVGVESKAFLLNVDLGESLIKQGKNQEALKLLKSIEKDYPSQPLNEDNIHIYKLLGEVSPNPTSYLQKELEELAKYQKETNTILSQQKQDELRNIKLRATQQIRQSEQKEVLLKEKRRYITIITLLLCLLAISFFLFFRKLYAIRMKHKQILKQIQLVLARI